MASRPRQLTRAYRSTSPRYPLLDGGGAYRWGSRWCSPGRWVVHGAETYALAVLENLVHWRTNALPPSLVCVEIDIPRELKQEHLDPAKLSGRNELDYLVSRAAGDDWYDRGACAVLWVPSVISPYECNVLFNRTHPDFARVRIGKPRPAGFDPRLWRNPS